MHNRLARGFTLIELLVVIAIIGVLSAVVLASLNTARSKGSDAAIKANLVQVRNQAEIYYGGNGNSYGVQAWTASGSGSVCTAGMFLADTPVARAIFAANAANGAGSVGCAANGQTYVVAAALLENTASYWCVDSTGTSKQVNAAFPGVAIASCP